MSTEQVKTVAIAQVIASFPLPEPTLIRRVMPDDYRYGDVFGFTADQMCSYAIKVSESAEARAQALEKELGECSGGYQTLEREVAAERARAQKAEQALADVLELILRSGRR